MNVIKRIDQVLATFSKGLCFLGAVVILFQMGLIVVDVCLRAFFHSTVVGASVIARNTLIAGVFLGLPYVTFKSSHTRAEVFYTNARPVVKFAMDVLAEVFGVVVFALMSYALVNPTVKAFTSGQFDSEATMLMPMWPIYTCVLFGAVFSTYAAVRCLVLTLISGTKAYQTKEV